MTSLLAEPLAQALAEKAPAEVVTADPFFAAALQAELPGKECVDIFTWASNRLGRPKPTAITLYEVYEKALKKIGLGVEGAVAEAWEAAQRLGRDWEEVLLGTLNSDQARKYWKDLAEHRQLQSLFRLYEDKEALEWLRLLPLPHQRSEYLANFWGRLQDFITAYEKELRDRGIAFSEEALQKIYGDLRQGKSIPQTFFVHLYTAYPLVEALLRQARSVPQGGWAVEALRHTLPEIWAEYPSLPFSAPAPAERRPVTIHLRPTLVEVVEGATEDIKNYLQKHPTAKVAIWCEGEAAALLRYRLEQADAGLAGQLSPPRNTLWEATQTGLTLQPFLLQGLRKGWVKWPEVPTGEDAAEKLAHSLYRFVQQRSSPTDPSAWQLLFTLLQLESPMKGPFSPSVRVYLGRLSQLAGGQYDALFLVTPPIEPLGSWERPSFWLPSLRAQFFPRAKHHQLRWRLMTILLWGSKEIVLWRQSAPEYQTPIEELLRYAASLGLAEAFSIQESPPAPTMVLPRPAPIEETHTAQPLTLSPSGVAQLFVCPRRFYWQQSLRDLPPTEAAELGSYLHTLIESTFHRINGQPILLRQVGYRLSWRRWYYRLGRLGSSPHPHRKPLLWQRKYHLLRGLLARATEAVGCAFYQLLVDPSSEPKRIPWREWKSETIRCTFRTEVKFFSALPNTKVSGRADLLIEKLPSGSKPPNAAPPSRVERILVDFKTSVRDLPATPNFELEGSWKPTEGKFTPPKEFSSEAFQLFSYAYFFAQQGQPIHQAALVSLWWRPKPKRQKQELPVKKKDSNNQERSPVRSYGQPELDWATTYMANLWAQLDELLPAALVRGTKAFPLTPDPKNCRFCSYTLLCDRLSSLSKV